MTSRVAKRYQEQKASALIAVSNEAKKRRDVINMSLGEPDVPTQAEIVEAARIGAENNSGYAPSLGIPELREAVRGIWHKSHGLAWPLEQVIITTGVTQASYMAFQSLINPGDGVILLEPYFPLYAAQVEILGGVIQPVVCQQEDGYLPTREALEAAVRPNTRIIMLNSPCNPSGAVFDMKTTRELADFALRHDLAVISDELYEPFVFEGEHIPFVSMPGMMERTVTMGGFSKSYSMCGWRVGYAMGPSDIIAAMDMIAGAQTLSVNTLAQRAALHALTHGEAILERMGELFQSRVKCAAEAVNATRPLRCIPPKGGFYVLIDVSETGMTGEEFVWKMLDEASVAMAPGHAFGGAFSNYVRMACTVPEEQIKEAFARIGRVLANRGV